METSSAPTISKSALVISWILTAVPAGMLAMSSVMKFMKPQEVVEGFARYGIPIELATGIGIVELACVVIYLIPRTSVLGAILCTGFLGGAVQIAVRLGDPWIGPVLFGVAIWGGLWLRDRRVRALIPLKGA
jgi:hypothetical protein